jgi:hypothetical protein
LANELALSDVETLDTLEDAQKFAAKNKARLLKEASLRIKKYQTEIKMLRYKAEESDDDNDMP